jgi:N-acylneuraminate cytidylyltransferase
MNVAIIPARGGSKRIPKKNIKEFCGKPMIAWSIEAALKSECFNKVVVSTDNTEIADIAQLLGAEVPFLRPASLSDDYTGTIPVVRHAIEYLIANGQSPELACCIYATAPFITPEDIRKGLDILVKTTSDYAFSVTSYPFPIQRSLRISSEERINMIYPENFNTRSQDLEDTYHDAGQFYWGRISAWIANKVIFSPESAAILLPRHKVQDIDTMEDWLRAELMFNAWKLT